LTSLKLYIAYIGCTREEILVGIFLHYYYVGVKKDETKNYIEKYGITFKNWTSTTKTSSGDTIK